MIKVTKVELFTNNIHGEPVDLNRTKQCPFGHIYVEWDLYEDDIRCALLRVNSPEAEGYYLTGRYFKRAKFYFENGYIWDTELKPEDEWRRKIYEELKKYVDSGYEDLPGEHQSELSRAARLLDDEMQYEI
jgi:hypothetical protein